MQFLQRSCSNIFCRNRKMYTKIYVERQRNSAKTILKKTERSRTYLALFKPPGRFYRSAVPGGWEGRHAGGGATESPGERLRSARQLISDESAKAIQLQARLAFLANSTGATGQATGRNSRLMASSVVVQRPRIRPAAAGRSGRPWSGKTPQVTGPLSSLNQPLKLSRPAPVHGAREGSLLTVPEKAHQHSLKRDNFFF